MNEMAQQDKGLPAGWVLTTLGNIRADTSKSIDPSRFSEEVFELYSVPSFPGQRPEITHGKEIGSGKRIVTPDTVLLCKINPRINRIWIVGDHSSHRKIASTEWIPFSKVESVYPKYLAYFMQNDEFRTYLAANASGVGGSLMRVSPTTVKDYPFPLAPLPEQHRIVAEIETQFSRLDAGVAALKRVRANVRRYKASVLKAACEGRLVLTEAELARGEGRAYESGSALLARILAERRAQWERVNPGKRYVEPKGPDVDGLAALPEGWVWATVEQLADVIGGLTKNQKRGSYPLQLPYLRVANVYANQLQLDDVQVIGVQEAELRRSLLQPGDLLVVEGNGSQDQIGRVALWNGAIDPCVHQNHIIKTRFHLVDLAQFVLYWLLSKSGRDQITKVASSTSGLYTLSLSKVQSLVVPLPPLAEQHRIVSEVERRLSVVQEVEGVVAASLRRAERLRQSILKQAFAGRLTSRVGA